MHETKTLLIRYLKIMINILVIYVLGWGLTPYTAVFQGLMLGTVISAYKMWTMYYRVNKLGQAIIEKRKIRSLGSLQRIAVSGLAVLIALRYPESFHLISVILGLMTYYIVIMINFIFKH